MTGCLFALLAALLAGLGARDQMLVANLSARFGPRPMLLATAMASGALASGLAAWASREVSAELNHAALMLLAAPLAPMGESKAGSNRLAPCRQKPGARGIRRPRGRRALPRCARAGPHSVPTQPRRPHPFRQGVRDRAAGHPPRQPGWRHR